MPYNSLEHLIATSILVTLFSTSAARGDDTTLLFDGKSLDNWSTLDGKPVSKNWQVIDGMIHLRRGPARAGHIVTRQEFGDFRLGFQWKIAPGGNSGLKYRVRKYREGFRGCEYQIIDDQGYHQPMAPLNSAGALYDLVEPNHQKRLQPPGQFNSSVILVENDRVAHWLNGREILSIEIGSSDWRRRVAVSKFSDLADFARNRRGKIMLTDHHSEVWYRNFVFTLLPTTKIDAQ